MPQIPRRAWPAACLGACALALLACCYGRPEPGSSPVSSDASPGVASGVGREVGQDVADEVAPAPVPAHQPAASSGEASRIAAAVSASLPYLEREGRAWMDGKSFVQEGSACVSCHQVPFALWAQGSARHASLAGSTDAWTALGSEAFAHTLSGDNGRPGIFAPLLLADVEVAIDGDGRRGVLRQLVESQERDGRWQAKGQFPFQRRDVDETDGVITLWTLLALHDATGEATGDTIDFAASRDRALAWLESQHVPAAERSTEWLAARLLLGRKMADPARTTGLLGELRSRQNSDGGWGFLAGDPSDAMTTGQVLYALAQASLSDDALRRGADYLLAGQNDDGSWTVPSRLLSQHPTERNDYVYDVWGTGWATIALATLERRRTF